MANGSVRAEDYTAEAWEALSSKRAKIRTDMKDLGDLGSMTLVDCNEEQGWRSYRYRLEFANMTVLQRFVLNGQNKLVSSEPEAVEIQSAPSVPETPEPSWVGIGVELGVKRGQIVIDSIVPNSPAAAQKDLHAGDRIIAVAQGLGPAVPVQSGKLAQAADLIRGPAGTTVRLTVASPAEDDSHAARVVSVVRADLKAPLR